VRKSYVRDVDCAPQGVPNIAYPWLLKNWDIFIRPLIRRNALIVGFVKKHAHRCMIRYVCIRQWHTPHGRKTKKTIEAALMASVLTHYFLANVGIVYGCTVIPGIEIKHIRIDNLKDAYKLKGSKYVQSSIVDVLSQIRQDVKDGTNVLFIGTPCQVTAVKRGTT
jgi:hypothetical protein